MKNLLNKIIEFFVFGIGKITWDNGGKKFDLTASDHYEIAKLLSTKNRIILTRRKRHLSTYATGLAQFIKTGRWAYWTHALINIEGDIYLSELNEGINTFKLVEATSSGVHSSKFMEVFNCDSSCVGDFNLTDEEWEVVETIVDKDTGKKYDVWFDYKNDKKLSCIELIKHAVEPFKEKLPDFFGMIEKYNALVPDMVYWSKDFKKVYEVRR